MNLTDQITIKISIKFNNSESYVIPIKASAAMPADILAARVASFLEDGIRKVQQAGDDLQQIDATETV